MYAVLKRRKNYELSFSHPGSLSVELFILLLDLTRIPATAFFVCFSCPTKRSLKQLIETVENLQKRTINLVSLTEHIDTTTATGKLFFQFIAMLAEFERNLISERTKAGLEAARARGHVGGRPKVKPTETKVVIAKQLHASNTPIKTILKTLNIKKSTFYRYLSMDE